MKGLLFSVRVATVLLLSSFCLQAQQSPAPAAAEQSAATVASNSVTVVPRLAQFSGVVSDVLGRPVTGTVTITFSLYELQEGGSPLWSETQSVAPDSQGHYTVFLGAASPDGLPLDLFTSGAARWLGVAPALPGVGEQPRVLLVGVPYALKASDADTLGGLPASAYLLAAPALGAASATLPLAGAPGVAPTPDSRPPIANNTSQPATTCTVTSDGTATANTVAKFTTDCNIENSLITDNGTGVVVGSTTPGALFDVQYSPSATTGTLVGQRVLTTLNPASTSSATVWGSYSLLQTEAGNTHNFNDPLYGQNVALSHNGTGTVSHAYGVYPAVTNVSTGTITDALGVVTEIANEGKGTISSGYGLYVNPPQNLGGGTFTNFYGLFVANPTAAKNNYSVYSAGGTNYFAGSVGIGTTSPAANLEVNGTAQFDQAATFKQAVTFDQPLTVDGNETINGSETINGNETTTGNVSATGSVSGDAATFSGNSSTSLATINQTGSGYGLEVSTGSSPAIYATGTNNGLVASASSTSAATDGVLGLTFSSAASTAGVVGESLASSGQTFGVAGYSESSSAFSSGVYGSAQAGSGETFGVMGVSSSNAGPGVSGAGVYGEGVSESMEGSILAGAASFGVWGDTGGGGGSAGLLGTADDNTAVAGYNDSSSVSTAYFENDSLAQGSTVLQTYGFYGVQAGQCEINTSGDLSCTGSKSAVVPVDNGQRRVALYAVEAPQNWFEDFGSGQLEGGSATVRLEATFAQTVNTGTGYHVFLTPEGDCKGLYVTNKTADRFEVRELGGGRSNVGFDYRIVALRKGYEQVRLADKTEQWKRTQARAAQRRTTPGAKFVPPKPPEPPVPARRGVKGSGR